MQEAADRRRSTLDRSLVTGIAWTGGVKWLSQVLSWVATLIVARLLSLGDYGIAGMAATYIGLVQLVSEFGLSAAVVQRRDLTDDQIAQLGGLSLALGALFSLLSLGLASAISAFFNEPRLRTVIIVLSATFVLSGLQVLPRSLLTRDLRFSVMARIEGLEAATLTVATITLALLRYGYWALVVGGLISRLTGTVLLLMFSRHRVSWPRSLKPIAQPVAFGAHVLVASLAWYAFRNADMMVVGRMLGTAALGAYTIGFTLASIPVDRISGTISRATSGIFAAVQDDAVALRRYLLSLTEGIAMITFPITMGMALVARDFVLLLLGEKWEPAIGALQVLAVATAFRSVVPLLNQVLIATGESRRNMQATVAIALVLPPLFVLGARSGIVGVATVWLVAYPVIAAAFMLRFALASCRTSTAQYLRSLWPAASATGFMVGAVLALDVVIPDDSALLARFSAKIAVGMVAYATAMYVAHGRRAWSFVQRVATLLAGSRGAGG